jgi:hypothetical protein
MPIKVIKAIEPYSDPELAVKSFLRSRPQVKADQIERIEVENTKGFACTRIFYRIESNY